jgi:hypothetical protein
MPKSEFDDQLTVSGGLVTVTGVVDADTNARAQESGADVDVHWVVAQGDLVAHGHVHADGKTFTQSEHGSPQAWKDGPAQVSGVTVTVSLTPRPAQVESFSWHQEVQLKKT